MKSMDDFLIKLVVLFFTIAPLAAQSHWFQAQSDKAEVLSVVSSSELVEGQFSGKYIYPPINILDENLDTTWCEAEEGGSGLGETITVELAEAFSFNEIQIVNGFASGNDYYHKNNRVAKITLTQTAGEHFQQKQYTLEDDREGWQSINFDLTQTAQTLTIKIDEVYRGIKYDDTCLSDIRFLMDGQVVPFANVQKIKVVQEEHSMNLLNNVDGAFMELIKQMITLSGEGDVLYFKKEGSNEVICFNFNGGVNGFENIPVDFNDSYLIINKERRDFNFAQSIGWCDVIYINGHEYFENDFPLDNYDDMMVLFLDGKTNFLSKQPESSFNRQPQYFMSDYKLTKISYIDYVETSTIMFLRLDGTRGIYINGEYHTLLNPKDFTSVYFESYGP